MKPKVWKMLGVAGLAGVAATGVIIARDERRRTQMSPEEVRAQLLSRLEEAAAGGDGIAALPPDTATRRPRRAERLRRALRMPRRGGLCGPKSA